MAEYHDNEWGVPSHDDTHLFEMLVLEGSQAGLSWQAILNKHGIKTWAIGGTLLGLVRNGTIANVCNEAAIIAASKSSQVEMVEEPASRIVRPGSVEPVLAPTRDSSGASSAASSTSSALEAGATPIMRRFAISS